MAETVDKPKLQLRSVASFNGEKSTSPATKLLINHGKPNFTLPRTAKSGENGGGPLSPTAVDSSNNYNPYRSANSSLKSNDIVVKSTKFNGVFKPANVSVNDQSETDNEAAKVVLRRLKSPELIKKEDEDDSVPEFILRQRRIQERLAKENVLDFENRRSGYFTHVLISPTSTNRTSFVETMSSPAVVPSLEVPPLTKREETVAEEEEEVQQISTTNDTNGHVHSTELEEEEVARAIEEVNKAVAGEEEADVVHEHLAHEDAHKTEQNLETVAGETKLLESQEEHTSKVEEESKMEQQAHKVEEPVVPVATTRQHIDEQSTKAEAASVPVVEEPTKQQHQEQPAEAAESIVTVATVESVKEDKPLVADVEGSKQNGHEEPATQEEVQHNGHVEAVVTEIKQNGHEAQNGHETSTMETITISHTNSSTGPCIPAPDPSGALGVNYEPKTVVSFSKDLGGDSNNYPDTAMVVKEGPAMVSEELQDMAKLKFEIKSDEQDVQVTPVLRAE